MSQMASACLWVLHTVLLSSGPATYNLLNVQQTQTVAISYDHRSCASIPHLCPAPVAGAYLTDKTSKGIEYKINQ